MANILDRIASETDLTKSERKLAGLILKDPVRVINETIADLAKRADVSEPTVFRFCKRFGAEGFPAFKLVLSSIANSEQLSPVESVKSGDSVGDVIKKSISSVKHQLSVLEHNLDEALIARVIDVVSQSRRLVILASGLSSVAGSEFSLRMLNLGFACEYYADPQLAATALVTLNSSDVVIAFSATGKN
ncbi:MAG: MurR/RpiR family transcriptional regulator, partial [Succinivibrio sp.]